MIVRSINIRREGDFGYGAIDVSKLFHATIQVEGMAGKVELNLSAEMSRRIIAIIADEVAAAGRATAVAMTAEILTVAAISGPKQ